MNIDQPQFNHPAFRKPRIKNWKAESEYWQERWEELSLMHDDVLILLDYVVNYFTENYPEQWASLPLGIQTRIASELGDLNHDEIVYEEDEMPYE